jgi:hypothetical protein
VAINYIYVVNVHDHPERGENEDNGKNDAGALAIPLPRTLSLRASLKPLTASPSEDGA